MFYINNEEEGKDEKRISEMRSNYIKHARV